ncbi:MAG: exodeoxyribonuclease VII large subunit [Clostridiales bacterium]|jgi:exodeoxyribonuclease VII large subunit|nr:exodeoxyribonuclease VII large subunit [Clostridiales bacterium]
MLEKEYLSVSELNSYLSGVIENDALLWDLVVKGEVSGISIHKENIYCTLKDEYSQIFVCGFKLKQKYMPKEGDSVLISGRISYYIKTGKLSFVATEIELCGSGKQYDKFQELKAKLTKEGLFEASHKILPPAFPQRIVVITSKEGAVIKDIYRTIHKQNKSIDVSIYNVSVQGITSVKEIVEAISFLDKQNFDMIILARGGGSTEDLSAYNAEEVVRAIYSANTYIISAIGHEVDFTLSDAVSDLRCLTPTAAGEFVVSQYKNSINKILSSLSIIEKIVNNRLEITKYSIINYLKKISQITQFKIFSVDNKISSLIKTLNLSNPQNLFNKGYFKIKRGEINISSVHDIRENDILSIYGNNGSFVAKVLKKD